MKNYLQLVTRDDKRRRREVDIKLTKDGLKPSDFCSSIGKSFVLRFYIGLGYHLLLGGRPGN